MADATKEREDDYIDGCMDTAGPFYKKGYRAGLEAAARVCEEAHPSRFGRDIAQRIRALKADKPTG